VVSELYINNTSGNYNTANGNYALYHNITGNDNTANGNYTLFSNTIGNYNTANGSNALYNNISGNNNTAIGLQALYKTTTDNNTACGYNSLYNNTTGTNNTAIGLQALSNNAAYSNCTGIGNNAQASGNNQVQLGDNNTITYAGGGAISFRSDMRDKADIRDTILGLDFINKLRAVDYRWDYRSDYTTTITSKKIISEEIIIDGVTTNIDTEINVLEKVDIPKDGSKIRKRFHHGLIAQELQNVITETGIDFGGFQDHSINGGLDVLSVGYTELICPMIKAIQELTLLNKALTDRVLALENKQ
jgi:hypothetical protein